MILVEKFNSFQYEDRLLIERGRNCELHFRENLKFPLYKIEECHLQDYSFACQFAPSYY